MDKEYILGLDIGIASVGYGLIDIDNNIIDAGVRLFPEANSENNGGRRSSRGTRRLLRRRTHRLSNVKYLLDKYNIYQVDNSSRNPYELRVKGLTKELTNIELTRALLHLAKRRGVHNVESSSKEVVDPNTKSTKEQLGINEQALREKYICEVQLEKITRGIRGVENRFKTSDYEEEARKLLEVQKNYNNKIDDKFIDEYIKLLVTRRKYYEGPGTGSEYGWEGDVEKWYETLMGRCSYFPEELRAVKYAHSSTLFNALNDLNNLKINRSENIKLTKVEKELLIEKVFYDKRTPSLKQLAKLLEVEEHDIIGFRVNTKKVPEFTTFKLYHDMKKVISNQELLKDIQFLDKVAEILTIWQEKEDIELKLEDLDKGLSKVEIGQIAELEGYTGTHSLSNKLIQLLLPELWDTPCNHMEIITQMGLKPKKMDFKGINKIPTNVIEDWILSPVVKRSLNQSIKIVNEIIKKYGYPTEIVIELAREKNSDDKKKTLKAIQKANRAINKEVKEILNSRNLGDNKGLFEKLKLWTMQDGRCLYSLEEIPIEDLLKNPKNYETDHIVPRSISFDNSLNNKVLVKQIENSQKNNRTPYQYLTSGKRKISYEKFKAHILQFSKDKMSRKKKEYLLEERDINKYDVKKEFINRNLVDTRYTTRELMNLLRRYFSDNEVNITVKSINGSFTSYLRKLWRFSKDREKDHKHHAEDALIVAMASHIFSSHEKLLEQNKIMTDTGVVDTETGEIISEEDYTAVLTEDLHKVKAIKTYDNYKYSHRIDKKPNRQLWNDTLYSTRKYDGEEYIINKFKNIYDEGNADIKKRFNKSPCTFLMYKHDPKTFKMLEIIMDTYSNAKNPLAEYQKETGEYLRKYSKKGNGAIVKSLKYQGKKLGIHKDISHKYIHPKNTVAVTKMGKYRMDVFCEEGVYKFVTVEYKDLIEEKNGYRISEEVYSGKLKDKKISNVESFKWSFYKYDLIEIDEEIFTFTGVNDDNNNKIEVNWVNRQYAEWVREQGENGRLFKTISKKNGTTIGKCITDILGNRYKSNNEKLVMFIPKGKNRGSL